MAKELKLWNGRASWMRKPEDPLWNGVRVNSCTHAYVAAYSRADARRVIQEYTGSMASDNEIKEYWNEGCWGNDMKGIDPVRGMWLSFGGAPVKVV